MFTWTEQAYATMWSHLRVLSHVHNAKRLLLNQLGGTRKLPAPPVALLEQKAAQVSYCIVQADEYFRAADSVSINTSPLLLFYGMLSLAKAVIVANSPDLLLDQVKYHGLNYNKGARAAAVEDQIALVNGGVFDELTQLVLGLRFPRGSAFVLRDVLAISPELSGMYKRYFGSSPRWLNLYSIEETTNPFRLELCVVEHLTGDAANSFPELAVDFDRKPELKHSQATCFVSKAHINATPAYFRPYVPVVGGRYVVGSLAYELSGVLQGQLVPPALSDYIMMFVLSDCVRYQQDLWGAVVQGRETGILSLIELALGVAKRRFPNMVLDELFGEPFEYGSPSRWM